MASTTSLLPSTIFNLTGRIALVTGGGTGIGLMCSQALAAAGAKVYLMGRRSPVIERAAQAHSSHENGSSAGQLIPIQGDVTDKVSIADVAKQLREKEGRLDILVSNAGGTGPRQHGVNTSRSEEIGDKGSVNPAKNPDHAMQPDDFSRHLLETQGFDDWSQLFTTNTSSCFFVFATFLPLLDLGSKHGQTCEPRYTSTYVTTSSISGMVLQSQMHMAYNVSKAATLHLTKSLAFEVTSSTTSKVRVNSIAPGVFPSEMTAKSSDEKNNKSDLSQSRPTLDIPVGRPGDDRDMAQAILFLASCEYLHGQAIAVDGGFVTSEP